MCVAVVGSLVACSGEEGPAGPPGPPAPPSVVITENTPPETFAALDIRGNVESVTVASAPVVRFSLADPDGRPIIGFGSKSQSSTATVASYPNLAFALAKLVPGTNGGPSKWVSYIVTSVPTTTAGAAPSRPSTDNTGTLVDNGDGTYTYTFYRDVTTIKTQVDGMSVSAPNDKADLGDLTWEPNLRHRLTIQISGNAPGTGTNTPDGVQSTPGVPMTKPLDVIYDFVPATGQKAADEGGRNITVTENCNTCHSTLGGIPGDNPESSGAGFHGGSRNDVHYCVVCHTDQRKYGRTEATYDAGTLKLSGNTYRVDGRAVGNLPNLIHKAHLGGILAKEGYNYADVKLDEIHYPQDIRNCNKCHNGSTAPQGDNWKTNPSRLACGACHDGIDFATGKGVTLADAAKGLTSTSFGHAGGSASDDSQCAACHGPDANGNSRIDLYHLPVTPPNQGSAMHVAGGNTNTNASWIASNTSRLPAGAKKVTYEIKSVSLTPARNPVIVFRLLQDGNPVPLQDPTTAANNPATNRKEIWENFMGSPSAQFVWSVPQDGVAAPQDFNVAASGYIRTLWLANGATAGSGTSAGTLVKGTGADDGYYVVTLTGSVVAPNAKMLTGGIGYSYNVSSTLPLTQTNVDGYPVPDGSGLVASGAPNPTGGLIVIAPNAQKVATNFTGRRAIVEDARCNACHQELGTFTEDAFHAGQRNDGSTCSWCHKPNQTSSGWSADSTAFIHSIHAAAKRTVPYTWHASSTTESFADIHYPGVLARCEQCHVPGSYDFSNSASADAVGLGADGTDKRLPRTVGVGKYVGTVGGTITTYSGTGCTTTGTSNPATDAAVFSLSPYVTADASGTGGTYYGSGFIHNAGSTPANSCAADGTALSVPPGGTMEASPTTLVTSPTVTVCSACHDSNTARSHMEVNGGSFYAPRSSERGTTEQCFVCHAVGRTASIRDVHAR